MSAFARFVDDASVIGGAPLHEACARYAARPADDAAYVGRLVLADTDLPLVRGVTAPLHVVLGGGAGQVAGPSGLARRLGLHLAAIETTLRDLDDLAGNARRVCAAIDAARSTGDLGDDTEVYVGLPPGPVGASWTGAADEVAAAGLRLTLCADGSGGDLLTAIDAALDRELPFRCTGLVGASGEPRGAVDVLAATTLLFDGLPGAAEAIDGDPPALVDPARGRRWFVGFASTDPQRSITELRALAQPSGS